MTKELAISAMELNESIHDKAGIKIQGGKKYTKVVHRVEAFRKTVGYDYGIDTDITIGASGALVKAIITNPEGRIIGSGSAFAKNITKDKSLEKTESTAIGRALASLALGGDEYAADEEVKTFNERYEEIRGPEKPKKTLLTGEQFLKLKKDIDEAETHSGLNSARDAVSKISKIHSFTKEQLAELDKSKKKKMDQLTPPNNITTEALNEPLGAVQ